MLCSACATAKAAVKRSRCATALCAPCFSGAFETDVHETIAQHRLFKRGDVVAVGVSGGKDSAVLLHLLTVLNDRYNYGLTILMVAIDEGIRGYRDDSLESVYKQQLRYKLPLKILAYKDLFGWSMDEVVARVGSRSNCTYCGVFRRQALERASQLFDADILVTGHNADDVAETVLMNLLRGDLNRLRRSTGPISAEGEALPRCKPLYKCYQKEIVLYARFNRLDYFATDCLYAAQSYRAHVRDFVKRLEVICPQAIIDIVLTCHQLALAACKRNTAALNKVVCQRCGAIASGLLCYACKLLDSLNRLAVPIRGDLALSSPPCIEDLCSGETESKCACSSGAD